MQRTVYDLNKFSLCNFIISTIKMSKDIPCLFNKGHNDKAVSSFFSPTFPTKVYADNLSSRWNDQRTGKCMSRLEQLPKNRLPRAHTDTRHSPATTSATKALLFPARNHNEISGWPSRANHLSPNCILKNVCSFYLSENDGGWCWRNGGLLWTSGWTVAGVVVKGLHGSHFSFPPPCFSTFKSNTSWKPRLKCQTSQKQFRGFIGRCPDVSDMIEMSI